MALTALLLSPTTLLLPPILLLAYLTHTLFLHPLSHIPGPFLAKVSPLWLWYHAWRGTEGTAIDKAHARFASTIVRISPNDLNISSGAALAPIYTEKGGFAKAPCYANFDIAGHATIFSTLDAAYRSSRAKPVLSLFSASSIRRDGEEKIRTCVDLLVKRLQAARTTGSANILDLSRCLALDAVTLYLFDKRYGGLDEETELDGEREKRLSASGFVDAFVAVGRFFLLPTALFGALERVIPWLWPDARTDASMARVQAFTDGLASAAAADLAEGKDANANTYQHRLLAASLTQHEVSAQAMDLMFAGTDSTGMSLATTLRHLCANKRAYARLEEELRANEGADPHGLPYLRAVVREGLRLAMANPVRLPRVVPAEGWVFEGVGVPAGTVVGVQSRTLHFNEEVFPRATEFVPERYLSRDEGGWLVGGEGVVGRDSVPFGLGTRQCIARNLATAEMLWAVRGVVLAGCLEGARPGREGRLWEWFNSKVEGHCIELVWN